MRQFLLTTGVSVLFVAVICGRSNAQTWEKELFFRNISTDEGLSNPTVNSMCEDARGYIWIGTLDGLNRYDGNEFKVYQPNPADSNSLPSGRINVLYEDSNFNLWIGTNEGLCQFNYKIEQFKNYKGEKVFDRVFDIAHDNRNNRIWMVSSHGQMKYLDLESGIINVFTNELLETGIAMCVENVNDDELYIGTANNGVYKLDLNSFTVEEFCNTKKGQFQIPNDWVRVLHHTDNRLFIGTEGGVIVHRFRDEKQFYYSPKNSSLPSAYITDITHDGNGDIYVGTKDGMAIYNSKTELISSQNTEGGSESAIRPSIIRSLFVDKKNDLWVGTTHRGIDYLARESRNMTLVKKKYTDSNSLSNNNLSSFGLDNNGGIWIGTQENGLNYYKNGQYLSFSADGSKNCLTSNTVTDICIDKNEVVWVSTFNGGLNAFKNGKFSHYMMDESNPNSIQSNSIRNIEIDSKGNLWLATIQGLESFDIEKKVFKHHFLDSGNKILTKRKGIRALLADSEGIIYAGTNTGLYTYDPISGKSEYFHTDPADSSSIGHNVIIEIFEDSKKQIWIGSLGGGLIHFDRYSKKFKSYDRQHGFSDNSAKTIEEDENGDLWIGTNKGIVKFSPSTEQVLIFGKSYGLQDNVFNINASLKCNDGRLIFGGVKGFNVFTPGELEARNYELDVIITDLKLFDKRVQVVDKPEIISKNISFVENLNLSYLQSKHFSISFSALQFSNPDQVQYAYKLGGFDKKWNYIGNENYVSFTNLEPGNYVLKLMASGNGQWKNEIKTLRIKIFPPWYMSNWFRISVFILLLTLIVAFYLNKNYTQKKRESALERLVAIRNNEIASQNKEIKCQNDELVSANEELFAQNESMVQQNVFIEKQYVQLKKVKSKLKIANSTLEQKITIRTRELRESNVMLNKTVKELDRFVYSASHDLSAPLKSVLGLVNIAKLEYKDQNLQIHLKYIEESIKKQEEVIKSLVQFSRNARQEILIKSLNLFDLVNQVILELRYYPDSDNANIINNLAKEVTIYSDEQRMHMVLTNLLSNSIKFRDKNKNDSFVKVDFIENENSWRLVVEDNGQGIAEDQQEKIFEMFHRANERSDGSGLGLFIVKEAVDRLEGKISLNSTLKQGSLFELEFPFLEAKREIDS